MSDIKEGQSEANKTGVSGTEHELPVAGNTEEGSSSFEGPEGNEGSSNSTKSTNADGKRNKDITLLEETKLLRDTLDLLWNQTIEQRNLCQKLEQENEYLQEYISNLMTSSNVLDK